MLSVFHKLTIVLLILLTGCAEKPSIEKDKLKDILVDAFRFEAGQQISSNYMLLPDSLWTVNYRFILKKHGVSEAEFKKTMDFYKRDPVAFSALLDPVIEELKQEEAKSFKR